jgi:cytochrome P450
MDDPISAHRWLREHCPVHYFEGFEPPFYTLSRYEDVAAALRDTDTFSSTQGQGPRRTASGGLFSDPPEHTQFRRLLQRAFTPRAIAEMEPFIEGLAAELVDSFSHRGHGDLHHLLASPLPTITIATMLGIPPEDRDRFKRWSDALVAELADEQPGAYRDERRELREYIAGHIDDRRAKLLAGEQLPRGLISALVTAEDEGASFTPAEIHGVVVQLLVGGNETTTSLITNAVVRLLESPTLYERVRVDLDLIDTVIEESLRFDAPVLGLFRTTTRRVHLHGVDIPANAKVMLLYSAANHDGEMFHSPDDFSIDRPGAEQRRHLGFGAGPHYCLGAPLARLEARAALRAIVERLPELRFDGGHERVAPFFLWGRRSLPVAWELPPDGFDKEGAVDHRDGDSS